MHEIKSGMDFPNVLQKIISNMTKLATYKQQLEDQHSKLLSHDAFHDGSRSESLIMDISEEIFHDNSRSPTITISAQLIIAHDDQNLPKPSKHQNKSIRPLING
jgi:hypothetical protein